MQALKKAAYNAPENEQYWVSYIDALILSTQLDEAISIIAYAQERGLKSETATLLLEEIKKKQSTLLKNERALETEQSLEVGVHVYQIYYSEETKRQVDPAFIGLDNLANTRPDWREFWVIRNYLLNTDMNEDDFYGFFSPKFQSKTNLSGQVVIDFVRQHAKDNDVVLFSPFFDQCAFNWNVRYQAMNAHENVDLILENCFLKIFPNIDLENLATTSKNTVFCNYFVAKPAFWRAWLALCEFVFSEAEENKTSLGQGLNKTANYEVKAPTKVFVIERVASLLLATQTHWRVKAYDSKLLPFSDDSSRAFLTQLVKMDALKEAYQLTGNNEHIRQFFNIKIEIIKGIIMNELALSADNLVSLALESDKAGRLDEAVEHYLSILSENPQHALANHNLGVIEAHEKGAAFALPRLENAVMANPNNEQYWVTYIDALMQSSALEQVLEALELGQQHGLSKEMANALASEFMQAHDAAQAGLTVKKDKKVIEGYFYNNLDNYYHPNQQDEFAYKDAGDSENRIYHIIRNAKDKSMFSGEVVNQSNDWPTYYHLTPLRANILRPFVNQIANGSTLELGAGCGAVTRFIGELGGRVVALEGSPNRARIIGNRCADLDNVTVISDLIQNFKTDEKFDVVTLIGVLEYAQVYVDSPDPIRTLLNAAKSFLKKDGVLVIAIENQLGLKYFCGSPEDHLGSPMFGINDSYTTSSPITFGRKELTQHIQSVGFEHIDLYVPLPDYKTPVTIVYPEGFADESIHAGWDVSPLLSGSAVFDWQAPRAPVFSLEAAWGVIGRNGLGQDLANSFLFAARVKAPAQNENILAAHYGCQRPAKFSKETQFLINDGTLTTQTRMVGNTQSLSTANWELGIYRTGKLWYDQLLILMNRPEWSHAELCQWTKVWVQALRDTPFQNASATIPELQHFTELLPANYVDATPTNLVVNHAGKGEFFDLEWNFSIALPIEFVVFRGLFVTLHRVTSCARPARDVSTKIIELVITVMQKIGLNVTADEMELFFALFNTFQNRTQGIESSARNGMMDILETANLPIRKLFT